MSKWVRKLILALGVRLQNAQHLIAQKSLPSFGRTGGNIVIELPRRISNPERIFFGGNVFIGPGSFLNPMSHYPTDGMRHPSLSAADQQFDSKIILGNHISATADLQVTAYAKVEIEDHVMFASNVHINDGSHGFDNGTIPYKYQPIFRIAPILIKCGSWIGQNVVIMSGVTIGENAIVGANSVVTRSIPDKCIAVGNPAHPIKVWDDSSRQWIKTG